MKCLIGPSRPSRAERLIEDILAPFAEAGFHLLLIFGPEVVALCSAIGRFYKSTADRLRR